ncbi:MAG: YggS family pyridoxal phosphate-dependent enzyme [Chitinophagaceae bacterium]
MSINTETYLRIRDELAAVNVALVAVSKTKPVEDIRALYDLGHRDFGENYVQELADKAARLPADIRWHFIGHLQSNKVKYIAPFVSLIHGIDSIKLLQEVNKQAAKNNRVIDCLLQVHIASEETKFGFDADSLREALPVLTASDAPYGSIRIRGLMGMASFTDNEQQVKQEFNHLHQLFSYTQQQIPAAHDFSVLSMGMSSDYRLAVAEGSTMVRIGSLLFGSR